MTVVLVYDGCYADEGPASLEPFRVGHECAWEGGQGDEDDGNQRGPEISVRHEC